MRSPRDIISEDELFYRQGGSEAYPDPYVSGSFRNMSPSIDPGLITNSMSSSYTNPWNDVSAAEQVKKAAGWYADTFLNTPANAKFPGAFSSYEDQYKYINDPDVMEDLISGMTGGGNTSGIIRMGGKEFPTAKLHRSIQDANEVKWLRELFQRNKWGGL